MTSRSKVCFSGVDGHACEDRAMDLRIDADGVMLAGEEAGRGAARSCCCTA